MRLQFAMVAMMAALSLSSALHAEPLELAASPATNAATQFDPTTARPVAPEGSAQSQASASGTAERPKDLLAHATASAAASEHRTVADILGPPPESAASAAATASTTQLAAARKQVQKSRCGSAYQSWVQQKAVTDVMVGRKKLTASTRKKWVHQLTSACKTLTESGNAFAEWRLGVLYETVGKAGGGASAFKKARSWYRKAADQGLGEASESLGYMFDNGEGVQKDARAAFRWVKLGAEQNDIDAMTDVARDYFYGLGTEKNYIAARKWFLKAVHADRSGYANLVAAEPLAEMYSNGWGVKEDDKAAIHWYKIAFVPIKSDNGNPFRELPREKMDAEGNAFNIGIIYYSGGIGVAKDYARALKWFKRSLHPPWSNSNAAGATLFYVAQIYSNGGYGVKKDQDSAIIWWRQAAAHGDADAMFNLGVTYDNGDGVGRSGAAAADWYYKAGVAYLKHNDRDGALSALQNIKRLEQIYGAMLPNGFLADKLLAKIYGNGQSASSGRNKAIKRNQAIYEGTGWPVAGGFVVTNHHVIAGRHSITVLTPAGATLRATVAADDGHNDLVLLKVSNPHKLPPAIPLSHGGASVGERVFTLGYPHPDLMGTSAKLTNGTVSSLTGLDNDPRLYQISVPLQSGNSGGPLLDMEGEAVGIVASKLDAAKVFQWTGDLPENVNYAIKASYLMALLQSVAPIRKKDVLPVRRASLEQLDKRVAGSILMIIAK